MKSISEGSAADLSNKIQINDRIVEVDGHSLQGYSNHEAVEVLRRTGQTVVLCLERYLRGPKYDQLQQAIAASELRLPQPSSPSITSLPSFPISAVCHLTPPSSNLLRFIKIDGVSFLTSLTLDIGCRYILILYYTWIDTFKSHNSHVSKKKKKRNIFLCFSHCI